MKSNVVTGAESKILVVRILPWPLDSQDTIINLGQGGRGGREKGPHHRCTFCRRIGYIHERCWNFNGRLFPCFQSLLSSDPSNSEQETIKISKKEYPKLLE